MRYSSLPTITWISVVTNRPRDTTGGLPFTSSASLSIMAMVLASQKFPSIVKGILVPGMGMSNIFYDFFVECAGW
jgi:hypothetical protein